MPVTRLFFVLTTVTVAGCTERTEKAPTRALPLVVSIDASIGAPVDPNVLALARDALERAKTIASKCTVQGVGDAYGLDFERFSESCTPKPDELALLDRSSAALVKGAPDAGPAASFAETVRLFDEALHLSYVGRGVLVHWQDVARSWNAFQPGDPVPVDIGKMGYGAERIHTDGGALVWGRCSDGPCIVIPKKKESLR